MNAIYLKVGIGVKLCASCTANTKFFIKSSQDFPSATATVTTNAEIHRGIAVKRGATSMWQSDEWGM